MSASLVGSEMCIRDSLDFAGAGPRRRGDARLAEGQAHALQRERPFRDGHAADARRWLWGVA
eukprot:11099963-Alexandrium_andersonii.AAC.1